TAGNEGYIGNNPWKLYRTGDKSYPYLVGSTYYPGVSLSQLNNDNLSWETDATGGVGIDIGLFANRITSSIDYFNKTKKNLLGTINLPSDAPVGSFTTDIGSQRSQG